MLSKTQFRRRLPKYWLLRVQLQKPRAELRRSPNRLLALFPAAVLVGRESLQWVANRQLPRAQYRHRGLRYLTAPRHASAPPQARTRPLSVPSPQCWQERFREGPSRPRIREHAVGRQLPEILPWNV